MYRLYTKLIYNFSNFLKKFLKKNSWKEIQFSLKISEKYIETFYLHIVYTIFSFYN